MWKILNSIDLYKATEESRLLRIELVMVKIIQCVLKAKHLQLHLSVAEYRSDSGCLHRRIQPFETVRLKTRLIPVSASCLSL